MNTAADDWFRKHRINVDEYYRMAEVGLLAHDARVELIQGEVVDKTPIGSKHAAVVNTLAELLFAVLKGRATVAVQQPVRLGSRSEPQPDLAVLRQRGDRYSEAHPTAADILLLIEVSDSTLRYDRDIKIPLYASHGIPEVWLIDLNNRQLLCMREPTGQRYTNASSTGSGHIELSTLPGASVDISEVLAL